MLDLVDVIRGLLELGADPTAQDPQFHATPLQWAEFLHEPAAADLLRIGAPAEGDVEDLRGRLVVPASGEAITADEVSELRDSDQR